MPPPTYRLGGKLELKYQAYGYRTGEQAHEGGRPNVVIPPGTYWIDPPWRNEAHWHSPEDDDGYYYRVSTPKGPRWIRQNELVAAVEGWW